MSWLQSMDGSRHELRYADLEESAWSGARSVAAGDDWFVNWADFPSVVPGPDGLLAAHWLQQRPGHAYSYDVRLAVSSDAGHSWSEPMSPHDDGTPTEHGFATLLPVGNAVLALWLDGRRTQGGEGHDHHAAGAMTLRSLTIDRAGLGSDAGAEIDARVCDCCQTDAALTDEGPIVVYRDRSAAEIRDIGVVRLTAAGWTAPQLVHADGWHMTGCPVNGPAIDARGHEVAVAWFTAPDQPRVRLAFSSDSGRTFSAPVEVAAGAVAGRVDVALLDEGRAVVSWLADTPGGAEFVAQPFARDGTVAGSPVLIARSSIERASGFPQMVRSGDRLIFAWTQAGEPPLLRTAVARLR
ncbi:MAG: Exo-alpha-sialidase [Pseudomonadota bacterium]|nr:Exo-alpha-sialidase [Pseudomonadota bacterium]